MRSGSSPGMSRRTVQLGHSSDFYGTERSASSTCSYVFVLLNINLDSDSVGVIDSCFSSSVLLRGSSSSPQFLFVPWYWFASLSQ